MKNTKPSGKQSEHAIQAPESDYLYIGDSQISGAGKGLFTAITIYREEIIAVYSGEIIDEKEAIQRQLAGADDYFMNLHDGHTLDCMNSNCFAKFANDVEGTRLKPNAFIGMNELNEVCLIANRTIRAGAEIFCSYGKKYWKKRRHKLSH